MAKYRLVNTLNLGDVLVQTIIWLVLVVVTFGLALPFFAYYFLRLIINKTEIHEMP
jgi:Kef-type K+ transport system membrane component KefB